MTRLTWTRLANGDLLCNEHPIRLEKPLDRSAESPGWRPRVPWEEEGGYVDGWRWREVPTYDAGWKLEANNSGDARDMVTEHLDHILDHARWDNAAYPEWTPDLRARIVAHEEQRMAEVRAQFPDAAPSPRAPRKPSLRKAAIDVEQAWTRYIDEDDLDAMSEAIGRLREALRA